jgi:steroid 5-alpha reductase family enzyme
MVVQRVILWWMIAEISCFIPIHRTFFNRKGIWWCLSEDTPWIIHEIHTNHQLMIYGWHYFSQFIHSQSSDYAWLKLIQHIYLDIKHSACLHVVYIMQYATFRPTTISIQETIVNAPKKKCSQLLVATYNKSTKGSTWQVSSSKWRPEWLRSIVGTRLGSIVQLKMWNAGFGEDTRWNTVWMQWRQWEPDQVLGG